MDVKQEINSLHRWNASLSRQLRDCSQTAASWIRAMIDQNKVVMEQLALINPHSDDVELPDFIPAKEAA